MAQLGLLGESDELLSAFLEAEPAHSQFEGNHHHCTNYQPDGH